MGSSIILLVYSCCRVVFRIKILLRGGGYASSPDLTPINYFYPSRTTGYLHDVVADGCVDNQCLILHVFMQVGWWKFMYPQKIPLSSVDMCTLLLGA